ncbi:MAG TPA: hypothetical protein VGX92_19215 [Pyrinomonadaceae bacterium]|nr:hypothetical protein [Pyrinomonadaceae bacterium]
MPLAVLDEAAAAAAGFLRAAVWEELFAFGFDCLLFEAAGLLDLVAFRAGAFSADERFTRGLGFADLLADERFLGDDPVDVWREAGREGDRFTPLTIGSLMRSSRFLKGRPEPFEPPCKNCASLT